jgi:hypothetical protein
MACVSAVASVRVQSSLAVWGPGQRGAHSILAIVGQPSPEIWNQPQFKVDLEPKLGEEVATYCALSLFSTHLKCSPVHHEFLSLLLEMEELGKGGASISKCWRLIALVGYSIL